MFRYQTSGTLTATDPDNPDNTFTPSSTTGTIGDFSIDAAGNWTFTANSAFDNLNVGDSVNETFNVTSVDGTPSTVQITINGTNDAATVSSDSQTLAETDVPVSDLGYADRHRSGQSRTTRLRRPRLPARSATSRSTRPATGRSPPTAPSIA